MSDEWPSHAQELGRKAMERIAADAQRYEDGEITADELQLTADVLSEVCQGLIDNETWKTVYAVRLEMDRIIGPRK